MMDSIDESSYIHGIMIINTLATTEATAATTTTTLYYIIVYTYMYTYIHTCIYTYIQNIILTTCYTADRSVGSQTLDRRRLTADV